MRMRSIILGFATAGAIALSTVAFTAPASAAPVAPSTASASIVVPNTVGSIVCSGNICIQRITSIINNKANVKAWAWHSTFTGHFSLWGPDSHLGDSPTRSWPAGGTGWVVSLAQGTGYTMQGFSGQSPPYGGEGSIDFRV